MTFYYSIRVFAQKTPNIQICARLKIIWIGVYAPICGILTSTRDLSNCMVGLLLRIHGENEAFNHQIVEKTMPTWMCAHISSYFRIQMMGFHEQVNTVTQKLYVCQLHSYTSQLASFAPSDNSTTSCGKSMGKLPCVSQVDHLDMGTLDRWMTIPIRRVPLKIRLKKTGSFRGFPMDSMEISVFHSDFHGNSIHIVAFQHGFPDDFVQAKFSDDHFWGVCRPGCGSRSRRIGAMPRMRKRLRSSRCMVTG